MKKLLLVLMLLQSIIYANDCDDYKTKAIKYEKMGMAESNLDLGAKYLRMAVKNKRGALNTCFYSAFDKEKIYKNIKEIEQIAGDMSREAAIQRQHDLDVAAQFSDKQK